MELVCPQCSKHMQVSVEELALHGGAVVCPQCLSVFDASEHVPEGTVADREVRVIEEHLTYTYCPHCGRKIPQGVNYCPYCGQELASVGADFVDPARAQEKDAAQPEVKTETETEPEPVEKAKNEDKRGHSSDSEKKKHRSSSSSSSHRHHRSSSQTWQPVMPSYRYAKMTGGWRSGKQKAGLLFSVIAWIVIVALLAMLAFIIHKVNMLP